MLERSSGDGSGRGVIYKERGGSRTREEYRMVRRPGGLIRENEEEASQQGTSPSLAHALVLLSFSGRAANQQLS